MDANYTVVIVDDEQNACKVLTSLLDEYCPQIGAIFSCTKPKEGIELVLNEEPDILFLDINMPALSGFDFLNELKNFKGRLIFTTAYEEYAIKAFKYGAFDYLLKPVRPKELIATIERLDTERPSEIDLDKLSQLLKSAGTKKNFGNTLALTDQKGMIFLKTNDIVFLESEGNYTRLHTIKGQHLVAKTLKKIEEQLDSEKFLRVHRSYVVNMNFAERYIAADAELQLQNGKSIPVSRRNRKYLEGS